MKNYFLLLLFFVVRTALGQTTVATPQTSVPIMGNWIKSSLDKKDGSAILDEEMKKRTVSMLIFRKGNVVVLIHEKKAVTNKFIIKHDSLIISNSVYHIDKLTAYELVFSEMDSTLKDNELNRYHYLATKESSADYYFRTAIKPYLIKKPTGDTAFVFNNQVFPKFRAKGIIDNNYSDNFDDVYLDSYEFIEQKANISSTVEAQFTVDFTVTKKGLVKNVVVSKSTDATYNNDLIQAVYRTQQFWTPAVYNDKPVDVQISYLFSFTKEKASDNLPEYDPFSYDIYLKKANRFFTNLNYNKAIKFYTKCILMREDAIEALYKRADAYLAMKVEKNACSDWNYLAIKGQKKAEQLFLTNCVK